MAVIWPGAFPWGHRLLQLCHTPGDLIISVSVRNTKLPLSLLLLKGMKEDTHRDEGHVSSNCLRGLTPWLYRLGQRGTSAHVDNDTRTWKQSKHFIWLNLKHNIDGLNSTPGFKYREGFMNQTGVFTVLSVQSWSSPWAAGHVTGLNWTNCKGVGLVCHHVLPDPLH